MTGIQKLQKKFWELIYPIFPVLERIARPLKFTRRQKFHIGWLHPDRSLDELREHLRTKWGFEHVVAAWTDDGQVLSWRKLATFKYQYHVRVFEDGEIRGHYEYTPEAVPLRHLMDIGMVKREEEFAKFLEGFIVREKYHRKIFDHE